MNFPVLVLLFALLAYPIRKLLCLRANLNAAKQSGLRYVVCPAWAYFVPWIIASQLVLPLLRKLPKQWQGRWLELMEPEWVWKQAYAVCQKDGIGVGADSFLIVTPESNQFITADPAVINQITARRVDFPKPIQMYKGIEIYGTNVVTSEGHTWRRHRKNTVPPFGEKNNKVVWKESLFQASQMVRHWTDATGETKSGRESWGSLISALSHDTMRLSLYVISRAGFGVRCEWPGMETSSEDHVMGANEIPKGHSMSYVDSLETLLQGIIALFILPPSSMKYFPFKALRLTGQSFYEWGRYMTEIYDRKKHEILDSKNLEEDGMDLMGAMMRTSGHVPGTPPARKQDAGLSKDEIIGNAFILFLAGHETAANSIHFAMLLLATRPAMQRKVQAELDSIFGDRDVSEWTYEQDLPRLFSGLMGAVMNEELRLVPPVTLIPKCTLPGSPQRLTVDGRECTVPGDCSIGIDVVAVHRNPKHWAHGPSRRGKSFHPTSNVSTDLEEFRPERWLTSEGGAGLTVDESGESKSDSDESLLEAASDTATALFRPAKGAYVPFSDGARACIGRRFAQVEILAALAVILHGHSIELSVDDYCAGEAKMEPAEKRRVWERAREEFERKFRDEMGSVITLQLRGKGIKVTMCKRGHETFDWEEDGES